MLHHHFSHHYTAGQSRLDSCEGDPHPNPPHKGEGTLPRLTPAFAPRGRQFTKVSANGSLPPLWGGVRGG
ncbi:MAG: hypothetical protein E5Y85_25465, partial [Mesorhizobium sp.]